MTTASELADLKAEMKALKEKMEKLERQQIWASGAFAGGMAVLAFFANGIKRKLGIG